MFSKGSKSDGKQVVPSGSSRNHSPSIISANLRITGNLVTDGVIQVDGIVDGDVKSDDLTLGESAVINGSIDGNRVRISGTVNGEISARLVELTRTAKVTGDINHTSLMIEAGAYVQGLCRHVEPKTTQATPKLADAGKPNLVVSDPAREEEKVEAAADSKAATQKKAAG